MKIVRHLACAAAVFAFSLVANATNLVQNPNFAASSYTYPGYTNLDQAANPAPGLNQIPDWTATPGAGSNSLNDSSHPFLDNGTLPAGTFSVGFLQGSASLSQTLTGLIVGRTYTFSFLDNARNCCGGTTTLTASIGGNTLYSSILASGSFKQVTGYFTATSSSELLQFSGSSVGDATSLVTNVSVAQTPEPSSLALLGTGLVGVVATARRKFLKA